MTKNILLDTIPANARNLGTVNLGFEITKDVYDLDYCHWRTKLDAVGSKIYVNLFYPTHIFNLVSFLKKNNIPLRKEDRSGIKIIAGGQGVANLSAMDEIADEIYHGESDGDALDKNGWNRVTKLESEPRIKGNKAAIELTRGCKYRCAFCEYSHVHGGKYREKDIELVKKQILQVSPVTRRINFMSANIGSYSKLADLVDFCKANKVTILNSDLCVRDTEKAGDFVQSNVSVGVESFNEQTRMDIKKPITDANLLRFFEYCMFEKKVSNIHPYLIYGLPNDNYEKWFEWLKIIADMRRKVERPVRVEFNITNFEPCRGTPLENAPQVDFVQKDEFLKIWAEELVKNGFRKNGENEQKPITYVNARGRFGRKQKSYELLMALKTRSNITDALEKALPSGVGRSISDDEADRFLKLL